jgi:hypothetical protein
MCLWGNKGLQPLAAAFKPIPPRKPMMIQINVIPQ